MSIEVFFNRPSRPITLDRLRVDIVGAQNLLSVACAWFTLNDIADAIIASPAKCRIVVLNQADLNRGGADGHGVLRKLEDAQASWRVANSGQSDRCFEITWLGADDYREGAMHHKFVAIDSRIVWTGSYNLTYQAAKNYETLLRIEDETIANAFEIEALAMVFEEERLWSGTTENAVSDLAEGGAFRCASCERICPLDQIAVMDASRLYFTCIRCQPKPIPAHH